MLPWSTFGLHLLLDHTAPGWTRLTRNWDGEVADTVRDKKVSSSEQKHAGIWWYFYDKRSKGSIFPTFSHRRSLLPHSLKPATSRSQEEFLCYATKYLAKQLRSVQQIKSNAKSVSKDLDRSNAFEHLGAGVFLNKSPLSAKIWNRSCPVNSSSHVWGTLKWEWRYSKSQTTYAPIKTKHQVLNLHRKTLPDICSTWGSPWVFSHCTIRFPSSSLSCSKSQSILQQSLSKTFRA